jgi:MOSC domain-containing protein YiiM
MKLTAVVSSIQVGLPRQFASTGSAGGSTDGAWTSGIIKHQLSGPVMVRKTNIDGDGQADRIHHGGVDKAVLAYASENYSFWKAEMPETDWLSGSFGENLTLSGVLEADVCVGDVFSLGECLLQISQPRQPCWKLSQRWNLPKLSVRVQQTRRTGWYLRVLEEGVIHSGQPMQLMERRFPKWTIQLANEIMFAKPGDSELDQQLASCPLLSKSWQDTLANRSKRSDEQNKANEGDRLGDHLK